MTEQAEFMGYRIERLRADVTPLKVSYRLHGPRATYTLVRCHKNPHTLGVFNTKGNVGTFKGWSHLTDRNGYLEGWR